MKRSFKALLGCSRWESTSRSALGDHRGIPRPVLERSSAIAIAVALVAVVAAVPATPAAALTREEAKDIIEKVLTVGGSSLEGNDILLHFDEVSCGVLLGQVNLRLDELARDMDHEKEGAAAKF